MKKLFFFLAALTLSFTAQATVVNCNPGSNNLAWYLTQGDTLVLADGEYSEAYSIDFDKPGVCVKAAEGAKPIIKLTGEWTALEVTATTTFDGITFDAGNVAQYIIATLDSTTFETDLTIKNCEFKNWNHWAISHYYQKNVSVNSIVIDNCLFHDAKNSAVYFSENAPESKNACQDLKITNSTFYNIGDENAYTTVYCVGGNAVDAQKVTVDYCTFYNCQAKNTDHAAVRVTCAATISNTIIAAPASQGKYRAIHATDGSNAKAINCLTYNYEKDNGGIRSGATKTDCQLNVDPKFVGAANGNFALEDGSPALGAGTDGSNLGDPRWNAPAVEEPTYDMEIVCTDMKTSSEGNMTHFLGTSEDGMEIDLIVFGFNGAGTYEGVEGNIYADGLILFTGTAEYAASAVEGTETNVLTADLALANGMTVKLTMYNLNAGDTDEPSTPGETITVEMYDATFTVEDGELVVEAENDDHAIVLWLSEWNGYGDYEAYSVWGYVDDVEVSNLTEGAFVEKDGLVATLYVVLTDGTNTYNVIVSGMAPAEAGDDDEPVEPNETITITANNLTASVPYDGVLLLKANANDADNTQIFLWLVDGDTKGYGEYGYSEYPSGLWPDIENASYGDVNLTLSEDVVAKYYQEGTIDKFEGTFLGDDNNLYILVLSSEAPATALDNVDTTVAPAKVINNGQLIIIRNGVQYNAQGAIVK